MKKQYRFLTMGALMGLLLTGVMPQAQAQDLDGTQFGGGAEVNNGDVYEVVYGIKAAQKAEQGEINMKGGEAQNLFGGLVFNKETAVADKNIVNINGGKVHFAVIGGQAQGNNVEASGNRVNISGGEIGYKDFGYYSAVGGFANTYNKNSEVHADNNIVKVTGGIINAGITGGYILGNHNAHFVTGTANENIVFIGGDAKVSGNVYGANADFRGTDINVEMARNEIIISGNADISSANLYGYADENSTDIKTTAYANTLTIDGWRGNVQSINNFDTVKFENLDWQDNEIIMDIADGEHSKLNASHVEADHIHFNDSKDIDVNDEITLIKADDNKLDVNASEIRSGGFTAGVAAEGDGEAVMENGQLVYKITGLHTAKQTKLVAENRAVAAAFVNQGTDLISDSLDALSRDGSFGIKTFAAVHGNASKYDVNSDIKINGWSAIAGVGNVAQFNNGNEFSWGVFYENGSGNYRTYNSFNDEFFRGDGSLVYNGGGAAARYQNAHGVYTEASLRAGMLKSEMSNALSDGTDTYGYESDANYYGAHIGVGQIIPLGKGSSLDVYGKFFHTYTEGDSFTVAGDEFSFDGVASDRLRIGARVNANEADKFSAYYGLAYEYEFNGEAKMRAAGMDAPEQSLKGSSYMAEAGVNYKPSPESPWSLDLNVHGYAGEREGASVSLQASYAF